MKNFFLSLLAIISCAVILPACSDDSESNPTSNYWSFNNGKHIKAGSVLVIESGGQVKALVSAKQGLTSVYEFNDAEDCTEISFPTAAIGTEIDLTKLTDVENDTYIISRLADFGAKYGLLIDSENQAVSSGKITSTLEANHIYIQCEFTTKENNVSFTLNIDAPLKIETVEESDNYLSYSVESRNISDTDDLRSAFYLKNTWDEGWTFTYSIASVRSYIMLGNNATVEIYVGSKQLLNGQPFNVAQTNLPFSFTINYLDLENQRIVPVTIDNSNRSGATGTITLTQNSNGLYDADFDVTLNNGDITVKGQYAGEINNCNMISEPQKPNVAIIRSATLDISSNPICLYLSTQAGTAGPGQYDIKCQVTKDEWRYGKFMAFSGQGSSITWIDGVTYSKNNSQNDIVGGNWRVSQPIELSNGINLSECCMTLYGTGNYFAYYYGEIKVIK